MRQPITLITEVDDGTIYFEIGVFEREAPGEKLQRHVGETFKTLGREWKHKIDMYPQGHPECVAKYLQRLQQKIPGIFQNNREGRYRLSPLIVIARIM